MYWRTTAVALTMLLGLALSSCGSSESDALADSESASSETTTTTTSTTTTTTSTTTTTTTTTAVAPPPTQSAASGGATMPQVVCMNLQDAQDLIQTTGVFYSRSFDASGQGRNQIVDSNWVVVSQSPGPGEPITEGSANLGAVKYGEPGAC